MKKLLITLLLLPSLTCLAQEDVDSTFREFLSLFPGKTISIQLQEKVLGIKGPFLKTRTDFEKRRAGEIIQQTESYLLLSVIYDCTAGGVCNKVELYSFTPTGRILDQITVSSRMGDCGFWESTDTEYLNKNELFSVSRSQKFDCDADSLISEKIYWQHFKTSSNGSFILKSSATIAAGIPYKEESFKLMSSEELNSLSIEELAVSRNTIFAIHGYRFKTLKWLTYFEKKKWYQPSKDVVDEQDLNPVERINLIEIKRTEALKSKN